MHRSYWWDSNDFGIEVPGWVSGGREVGGRRLSEAGGKLLTSVEVKSSGCERLGVVWIAHVGDEWSKKTGEVGQHCSEVTAWLVGHCNRSWQIGYMSLEGAGGLEERRGETAWKQQWRSGERLPYSNCGGGSTRGCRLRGSQESSVSGQSLT